MFASLQTHIEAYTRQGGDLIPLHIGDTYLAPPLGEVPATGHQELSMYGAPAGVADLRDALAQFRRSRGLTTAVSGDNVHVGCGCTHALFCAARAVLDPGDAVLVVSPFWPLITGLLRTAGIEPIEVPLTTQLYQQPDLDLAGALEAAMTPRVRALYFVTPNNPDGHIMSRRQIEQLAAFALRHDLWVLADEVYADFIYEREHVSIATCDEMGDRTITSHSLSKSHALAGARIGYVIAPERVIQTTRRISNHTVYNVPVAMQRAALAAVEGGDAWLARARDLYREARDAAASALASAGLSAPSPHGGSFLFMDLAPHLGTNSMHGILEAAIAQGVLLAPGDAFGVHHGTSVRLCFTGVPVDRVREGVRRFARAL